MSDRAARMDSVLNDNSLHEMSKPSVMPMSANGTQQKLQSIEEACQRLDFDTLVELATSTGGLLTDELRRRACTPSSSHECIRGTSLIFGRANIIGLQE